MGLTLKELLRIYHILKLQLWLGAKDFDQDELESLATTIEDELEGFKLVIVKNGRR